MLKMSILMMIVLASTGIGCLCAGDLKRRTETLQALLQIFLVIQGEIRYGKTPFPEIFERTALRVRQPFKSFLEHLHQSLSEKQGMALGDIFEECVDKDLTTSGLLEDDLRLLKDIGKRLGYLDVEMQQKNLELYIKQLEASIKQAQEEYRNKGKVYHCLGVMSGLFLVIVLI